MDANTPNGLSRPKVHRLPKAGKGSRGLRVPRIILAFCMALMLVAVIPLAMFIKSSAAPAILNQESIKASDKNPEAADNALLVHDENGQVVGQLARIPVDAGQGMNVKTTKNVDNNTGKELLSIIGKY